MKLFVGTSAEYNALTEAQKRNLFAIITDENHKKYLHQIILRFKEGSVYSGATFNYISERSEPFTTVASISDELISDGVTIPASGSINSNTVLAVKGVSGGYLVFESFASSMGQYGDTYLYDIQDNVVQIMGGE